MINDIIANAHDDKWTKRAFAFMSVLVVIRLNEFSHTMVCYFNSDDIARLFTAQPFAVFGNLQRRQSVHCSDNCRVAFQSMSFTMVRVVISTIRTCVPLLARSSRKRFAASTLSAVCTVRPPTLIT